MGGERTGGAGGQQDFTEGLDRADWALHEFEHAPLVDHRLCRRLSAMACDFARHPGGPIPQACSTKAEVKGAYRFIENDFVMPQQILAGHRQASLSRLAREAVVLAVSDSTAFNYSSLHQTQGLGPIGNQRHVGLRGLWLHSTLTFSPRGLPLGLVFAQFWSRPEAVSLGRDPNKLPFEEKESVRWRQSFLACQGALRQLAAPNLWVNLTDMEGDIYEVFRAALAQPAPRVELLVRSQHNRQLVGQKQRFWQYLAQQPSVDQLVVRVPRHPGQPARLATVQIRFTQTLLEAPAPRRRRSALPLWAVEAREINPPANTEALLWRLVTTLPVTTAAAAMEKVQWYSLRWGIEVFHKIVKSVCRAEESQLQTAQRLERALMIDLVVAWRTHVLTLVARQDPDIPASDYFAECEWKGLYSYIYRTRSVPAQTPRLSEMMFWIGRLGGFLKCKANPYPGPITLARGLSRLSDMAEMWSIHHVEHEKGK
jgi:hypothetical protein